jgi:hypothetical protein
LLLSVESESKYLLFNEYLTFSLTHFSFLSLPLSRLSNTKFNNKLMKKKKTSIRLKTTFIVAMMMMLMIINVKIKRSWITILHFYHRFLYIVCYKIFHIHTTTKLKFFLFRFHLVMTSRHHRDLFIQQIVSYQERWETISKVIGVANWREEHEEQINKWEIFTVQFRCVGQWQIIFCHDLKSFIILLSKLTQED